MCPHPDSDDRPDVVLVHGVGVGPESFAATRAALSAAGRRVHGVVRPGYGRGEHAMDLEAQVDIALEGIDQLIDEVDPHVASTGDRRPAAWVGVRWATPGMMFSFQFRISK